METARRQSEDERPCQSVEQVVEAYTPGLRSFIRSKTACREDAEDILQEVFYQLCAYTAGDVGRIEQLPAWLYRVARNTVLNFWRKRRECELPGPDGEEDFTACEQLSETLFGSSDSPDVVYLRKLVWQELDMALEELPPEQREAFCLTVFDGMPVKEVARLTGVSVPTLLSRKFYAVRFLRGRLGELYNDIVNF